MKRLVALFDRSFTILAFKYILGIGGLVWLLWQADWRSVKRSIVLLSPQNGVLLVLSALIGVGAIIYSWYILFATFDSVQFSEIRDVVLVYYFVGQLSPSNASAFVLMPLLGGEMTDVDWATSTGITAVHTALYAGLYALVGGVGVLLLFKQVSFSLLVVFLISVGAYLGFALLLIVSGYRHSVVTAGINRLFSLLPILKDQDLDNLLKSFSTRGSAVMKKLLQDRRIFAQYTLSWAVGLMLMPAVRFYLVLSATGDFSGQLLLLPVYVITAYSITVIPLTPGGIGVAELSTTFVFTALGFTTEAVVAAVIIDRFISIYLPSIVGGIKAIRLDIR